MSPRTATLERKSKETQIKVTLNIDGKGAAKIKTPIGLLNHMLELFAFHGLFDLKLEVKKSDTGIDIHHTNEDIGIVLGQAFKKALGEKQGIRRFGWASAPMESTLGQCTIDISGRGFLTLHPPLVIGGEYESYPASYVKDFLEAFSKNFGATMNIKIENPCSDPHTNLETVFKSFGLALDQATQIDPRRKDSIPSTKGIID